MGAEELLVCAMGIPARRRKARTENSLSCGLLCRLAPNQQASRAINRAILSLTPPPLARSVIAAGASVIRFTVAWKIASASERNLRRICLCNFANDITRGAHLLHFCTPPTERDCVFAGNRFRSKFNYLPQ